MRVIIGTLFLAAASFSGCGLISKRHLVDEPSVAREPVVQNHFVFVPQEKDLCGPTVLKMLTMGDEPLAHISDMPIAEFRRMAFDEKARGTYKTDFLSASRRLGLVPYRVESPQEMLSQVRAGDRVVVFQNLTVSWYPTWHYAILTGYDRTKDEVTLQSGKSPALKMRYNRFLRTWERGGEWSYVFVAPDQIPRQATFAEALENAMVFDELKMHHEALKLYSTMQFRWPDRFEPYLGTAHSKFARGDLEGAVDDLIEAISRNPEEPALFYNVAMIFHQQGQDKEALSWKYQALELIAPEARHDYAERFGF